MAVIVIKEQPPIKACKCNAPIIAELKAKVKGLGLSGIKKT